MLRRALASKKFALMGLQHALQDFATLCGHGVRDADAGNGEALFGVELGILVVDAERGLRDEPKASPFEVRAELKDFGHRFEGGEIAFPRDHTLVLDRKSTRLN